jgi:hypothetical protein
MQVKCQLPGETVARSAYPLDSLKEPIFRPRGGDPRGRIEGGSFGADIVPAATDLKGSPHEGGTREGDHEFPEPTRSWSWPSTWRRLAATAVSGIAASLIEGLAIVAAAEHPELLLPLRDYWSQDNAAKGERGLGEPVWSVDTAGSSPVITRKQ